MYMCVWSVDLPFHLVKQPIHAYRYFNVDSSIAKLHIYSYTYIYIYDKSLVVQ